MYKNAKFTTTFLLSILTLMFIFRSKNKLKMLFIMKEDICQNLALNMFTIAESLVTPDVLSHMRHCETVECKNYIILC